jgi:hypothetical protein
MILPGVFISTRRRSVMRNDPFGPRRLSALGLLDLCQRLNLGSEAGLHGAYAVIAHCRKFGHWTPFSLAALNKTLSGSPFPAVLKDLTELRDARFVEKVYGKRSTDCDQLFQITSEFKAALFGRSKTADRSSPPPRPVPVQLSWL